MNNNRDILFSGNKDWLLSYSFFDESINENKKFIVKFNELTSSKAAVVISDISGKEVYSGTFEGFIDFLAEKQKSFYSESAIHRLAKEQNNKKIQIEGSPFVVRRFKKDVYDEITAKQTIFIEDSQAKITKEIIVSISLEKQY